MTAKEQAFHQAMALLSSFLIAAVGGILTSLIMKLPLFEPFAEAQLFNDTTSWLLPPQEVPFFIGNESNCEMDYSEECSTALMTIVETLQLPPQQFKNKSRKPST